MICEKVVSKISFHDFGHYIFIAESLGGFLISITYFDKGISQIRRSDRLDSCRRAVSSWSLAKEAQLCCLDRLWSMRGLERSQLSVVWRHSLTVRNGNNSSNSASPFIIMRPRSILFLERIERTCQVYLRSVTHYVRLVSSHVSGSPRYCRCLILGMSI
jgi:hypothetical protein